MDFSVYKKSFSTKSTGRYDIAPIYSDFSLFESLTNDVILPFEKHEIDKIIAIDALGFVLGTAVSIKLKKGLVLVRKQGKIPLQKHDIIQRSFVDYTNTEKFLEINRNLIVKNDRCLIVDDWVETGAQIKSVISMLEELGARIMGIASIGSERNDLTEELFVKYNLKSIGINV